MPIVLYQIPPSPPCRAVEMTAQHLGLELERKQVNLFSKEQMQPEFLAINPQHCVPTLDDDGFVLWESRAIITYLVNKYAPESPLYPKDPKARAIVNKMLNFDLGTLFAAYANFFRPQAYAAQPADPEKEENFKKALAIFEKILEKSPYAAGNHLTVADYSILSYLLTVEEILDFSFADFPKISNWLQKMKKETPNHKEINEKPLKQLKEFLKSKNFNIMSNLTFSVISSKSKNP